MLFHDPRLAEIDVKAFFDRNRADGNLETIDTFYKPPATRKQQIIGVPSKVNPFKLPSQSRQPDVHAKRTMICNRWRRWSTLGKSPETKQLWYRIFRCLEIRMSLEGFDPDLSRRQHCQEVTYTPFIARGAKQAANSPGSDMVEEVPQVHLQTDRAIAMRLGKVNDVFAGAEATSKRMSRDQVQDFAEDLGLHIF